MRVVKHQLREAKTLYDFTLLQQSDDDKNRVVFLSERDMSIIWTAIYFADKVQPRVFYDGQNDLYNVVSDEDFQIFKDYVNSLRVTLGEWPVSNQYLERIAVALENIDAKTQALITWDEMLEDLENTLGIGNAFVGIVKWIGDLFPQVRLKLDMTWVPVAVWEYFTWKAPILALLTAANASLAGLAAAALAEKPLSLIRTVTSTFDSILSLNNRIYEFILGDWNWYDDILKPIWESFVSTGEGGTGGDNPDSDPDNRIAVSVNQTNIDNDTFSPTINVSCSQCGSSGGCGCSGGIGVGSPSGGSVIDVDPAPDLPSDPNTDPPPDGFDTWTDYNDYKCTAANAMFDSVVGWFRWLGGLDAAAAGTAAGAVFGTWLLAQIGAMLAAAAATTAAGGFVVTTALAGAFTVGFVASAPGWVLAAIVAAIALVTALVGVGLLVIFDSLADDFEAKKDDIVCQLYGAQTIAEASSILSTALSDSINSFVISSPYDVYEAQLRVVGSTVVSYMLPNSFLNQLFERSAVVEAYTASTSDCEACCPLEWSYFGTPVGGEGDLSIGGPRTVSSTVWPSNGKHYITFSGDCACDGQGWLVTVHSMTGYDPYEGGAGAWDTAGQIQDCEGVDIWTYAEATEPSGEYCGKLFQLSGQDAPFSASISIVRCDPV